MGDQPDSVGRVDPRHRLGFGFVVVAWTVLVTLDEPGPRAWLLVALTTIWGLRLTIHLARRNIGEPEDRRYQSMRRKHGDRFPIVSLYSIFGLQAAVIWIVSLPVQVGQHTNAALGWVDALGVLVFSVGLFFETLADLQLERFRSEPDNDTAVLESGLWKYTRHPNYFGDFTVWWGLYGIGAAGGAWWTIIGPVVMSVFLMKISGVGMLERTIGSRRPGYAEYVRRTNTFFPGPPRAVS